MMDFFLFETRMDFSARFRADSSAVYTELSEGIRLLDFRTPFDRRTAEAATPFSDLEPSVKIFWCKGYFKHSSLYRPLYTRELVDCFG